MAGAVSSATGLPKRNWVDYSAREFAALKRGEIVAVLPLGATEQHGPHLPLSVDACIVDGVVDRLASRLPAESPALFLPTQAVTKSVEHADWPGTLYLSSETVMRVWVEIGACVARAGVRKLVLLNAHGGNIAAMDVAARELRFRENRSVFCLNWFGVGMPDGVFSEREQAHGIHAGDMETSVMLALDPANVDMAFASDFRSEAEGFASAYPGVGLAGPAKPAWLMQDMNAAGACGEAHLATAEKGRKTLDHAVDRLVEILRSIERFPVPPPGAAPLRSDRTDALAGERERG